MKHFYLTFLIILVCNILQAQQQVSISTAKIAAINTMRNNKLFYTAEDINSVNLYISKLDTILYEVKFNDNHSVLLSGSLACQPVLGYSFSYDDETALDHFDEIPPGFQSMIQEYIDQIELCFANDTITLWHEQDWENLMKYNRNGNEVYDVVSPLITTQWGQDISNDNIDCHAYNHYIYSTDNSCNCSGDHYCPAGCTAVAMAQIMNYWKHPVYHPWYGPNQFDWCNMPDSLMTNRPNYEKERNAVARLMQKCGYQINMNYCFYECNSFAWPSNVKDVLEGYYQYSSDADFQMKASHNIDTWIGRMKNNLNHNWPFLYAGGSLNISINNVELVAHSFVCDGYRSDNTFHFNWGWNGHWNTYWLTVNSLSVGGDNFNSLQQAVFYIYPANNNDYCHFSASLETYFRIYSEHVSNPSIAAPKIFDTLVSVSRSSNLDVIYRTIPDGENIEYVAHKKVKLIDGFHAEEGSHFVSYIDECEKCEEEGRIAERVGNLESIIEAKPSETESDFENKVNIIPNPNNGSFYVALSNNEAEITGIRVFDITGKIIYLNNRFNGGEIVLPNAKQGLYYVVVTLKDKTITEKIIIQ